MSLYSSLVLADGTNIWFRVWNKDCIFNSNACGFIGVDTNGKKGPNQYGVDTFSFFVKKDRIEPVGLPSESVDFAFTKLCNLSKSSIPTLQNGFNCTAWVVFNGNMDYLHCNDLSWSGKKKCD